MKKVKITFAALAFVVTAGLTISSYAGSTAEPNNCSTSPNSAANIYVADLASCNSDEEICCYLPFSTTLKMRELSE